MNQSTSVDENQENWVFQVRMTIWGPLAEMDAHLNWIRDTVSLTDWDLRMEEALSKTGADMGWNYRVFEVISLLPAFDASDAVTMMLGLCSPLDRAGQSHIEIDAVHVTIPYFISEEP